MHDIEPVGEFEQPLAGEVRRGAVSRRGVAELAGSLSSAISSFMLVAASEGWTTIISGATTSEAIGAKLLNGS
jgi:hypothetical protein